MCRSSSTTKDQPDILVPIRSGRRTGLAIEFKSLGWQGEASEHQKMFLQKLESEGWQVLVSNCYEDILLAVRDYLEKPSTLRKKRQRSIIE